MLPALIRDRAKMLADARRFFAERGVLEVDCCALRPCASVDVDIDAIPAETGPALTGYLHTSPEYAMKQLLAEGIGDIYFLGHVFRHGEIGARHAPEFTMAEWYRIGFSFDQMIQETCDFISLFLGHLPIRKIGYREAFATYLDLDYTGSSLAVLRQLAAHHGLSPDNLSGPRNLLIQFLLSHAIEPHLGRGELTILCDYPPQEAALACVVEKNGELVSERFEAYHQGVELSNGYRELSNADELRHRFQEQNALRLEAGKPAYALDEPFLAALGRNFPECCGVSVGIDRLLLLKHRAKTLSEVLPFAWV